MTTPSPYRPAPTTSQAAHESEALAHKAEPTATFSCVGCREGQWLLGDDEDKMRAALVGWACEHPTRGAL